MACAQVPNGMHSTEGWSHHQQRPHTQPSSRVGSAHPRSPSRRDPGHGHVVLVAPGPPGQHPREAGPPLRCCHSYQRALGLGLLPCSPCRRCPSWGITGLGRSEAGECLCRHLGLLCIFPTTGFKQITGLFFFLLLPLQATVSIH